MQIIFSSIIVTISNICFRIIKCNGVVRPLLVEIDIYKRAVKKNKKEKKTVSTKRVASDERDR